MLRDENEIVEIELAFEKAKSERRRSNDILRLEKGRYHTQLIARRGAGETLTAVDMRALEDCAIESVPAVKAAYLNFVNTDADYRIKKVKWESTKRQYWDSKGGIYK